MRALQAHLSARAETLQSATLSAQSTIGTAQVAEQTSNMLYK